MAVVYNRKIMDTLADVDVTELTTGSIQSFLSSMGLTIESSNGTLDDDFLFWMMARRDECKEELTLRLIGVNKEPEYIKRLVE